MQRKMPSVRDICELGQLHRRAFTTVSGSELEEPIGNETCVGHV